MGWWSKAWRAASGGDGGGGHALRTSLAAEHVGEGAHGGCRGGPRPCRRRQRSTTPRRFLCWIVDFGSGATRRQLVAPRRISPQRAADRVLWLVPRQPSLSSEDSPESASHGRRGNPTTDCRAARRFSPLTPVGSGRILGTMASLNEKSALNPDSPALYFVNDPAKVMPHPRPRDPPPPNQNQLPTLPLQMHGCAAARLGHRRNPAPPRLRLPHPRAQPRPYAITEALLGR